MSTGFLLAGLRRTIGTEILFMNQAYCTRSWALLLLICFWSTIPVTSFDFDSTCSSIAAQIPSAIPDYPTTVRFTELVSAGTNLSLTDNDPSCGDAFEIVLTDICRIAMSVATSEHSEISLEAWLPRNWTGRFLTTGNGGLGGCMSCFLLSKYMGDA
jgi:feruloyl esterase